MDFSCSDYDTALTDDDYTLFAARRKSPPRTLPYVLPTWVLGLSGVNQNAIIRRHLPASDRAKPQQSRNPGASKAEMTQEEERELRAQLAHLQQEHRDLDAAIAALQDSPGADIIQVQRLKKRKLHLRDRITFIEDQLTPDIIA